jgi:hypothetical protein
LETRFQGPAPGQPFEHRNLRFGRPGVIIKRPSFKVAHPDSDKVAREIVPENQPGAVDFWFCGNKPVEGLPYCEGHARIAYQPASR